MGCSNLTQQRHRSWFLTSQSCSALSLPHPGNCTTIQLVAQVKNQAVTLDSSLPVYFISNLSPSPADSIYERYPETMCLSFHHSHHSAHDIISHISFGHSFLTGLPEFILALPTIWSLWSGQSDFFINKTKFKHYRYSGITVKEPLYSESFGSKLSIWCFMPLILEHVFIYNKDILLHNHDPTIKIRKLILMLLPSNLQVPFLFLHLPQLYSL